MTKRVFIVHGWGGHPAEGWFPWLKAELEKKGFLVAVPQMPDPQNPTVDAWVAHLASVVGIPDANTYFVGHSMGCQAIMRYLGGLSKTAPIGGIVFVGGWFTLKNFEEEAVMVKPWLELPINFEKIKAATKKIAAIFSPTDIWVSIENQKLFEEKIGAQIFIEDGKGERGHFSGSDGVTELPKVLELILQMSAVPTISIDDVAKLEIKMGTILSAERVEGGDKLLKFTVDFGSEKRTIVSGVAKTYAPAEMFGKQVPVITNLAPRKMKGIESQGMIVYAIDETIDSQTGLPSHHAIMLNPQREVPPGSFVQ